MLKILAIYRSYRDDYLMNLQLTEIAYSYSRTDHSLQVI